MKNCYPPKSKLWILHWATKCQHKLLMGEENNRCKTEHTEIVFLLMSRRQKSGTSQRDFRWLPYQIFTLVWLVSPWLKIINSFYMIPSDKKTERAAPSWESSKRKQASEKWTVERLCFFSSCEEEDERHVWRVCLMPGPWGRMVAISVFLILSAGSYWMRQINRHQPTTWTANRDPSPSHGSGTPHYYC